MNFTQKHSLVVYLWFAVLPLFIVGVKYFEENLTPFIIVAMFLILSVAFWIVYLVMFKRESTCPECGKIPEDSPYKKMIKFQRWIGFKDSFRKVGELMPQKCERCQTKFHTNSEKLEGFLGDLLDVSFGKNIFIGFIIFIIVSILAGFIMGI